MRRITVLLAVLCASVFAVVGFAVSTASASTIPSNFPGTCESWHGAPGGLGVSSPYYFVRTDPDFGLEQGPTTTGNNNATDCGNTAPASAPGLTG